MLNEPGRTGTTPADIKTYRGAIKLTGGSCKSNTKASNSLTKFTCPSPTLLKLAIRFCCPLVARLHIDKLLTSKIEDSRPCLNTRRQFPQFVFSDIASKIENCRKCCPDDTGREGRRCGGNFQFPELDEVIANYDWMPRRGRPGCDTITVSASEHYAAAPIRETSAETRISATETINVNAPATAPIDRNGFFSTSRHQRSQFTIRSLRRRARVTNNAAT